MSSPFEAVLVEPLYQLVRQQLLAWRIEQAGAFERVRVLHIAPATNAEYWRFLDRHEYRRSGESVRDVWQRMLRDSYRDRFLSLDNARFTSAVRSSATRTSLALALAHGTGIWSTDTDFARFPGLRWEDPLSR